MTVFPPLLDALELIHSRQQLHLDIKPSNIHLRPGGKPLLLDDETLAKLVELLRDVAEQEKPKSRTTRSSRTK